MADSDAKPSGPNLEPRVAVLEQIARDTQRSLDRIERRFETIDQRFDLLDHNHRSDFRWLMGVMLGGFVLTLGAIGGLGGLATLPALRATLHALGH